jgi:hypothetical protein
LPIKQVPILLAQARQAFGKANQKSRRSEGPQVTRGVGWRNGTPLCNSIP